MPGINYGEEIRNCLKKAQIGTKQMNLIARILTNSYTVCVKSNAQLIHNFSVGPKRYVARNFIFLFSQGAISDMIVTTKFCITFDKDWSERGN